MRSMDVTAMILITTRVNLWRCYRLNKKRLNVDRTRGTRRRAEAAPDELAGVRR